MYKYVQIYENQGLFCENPCENRFSGSRRISSPDINLEGPPDCQWPCILPGMNPNQEGGGRGGGGLGACPPEIFQKCMVIMCVLVQIYTINLEDARPLCLPPSTPPLSDSGCSSLFIERRRRRKNFFHGRPTIRSLPEGFNTFIPFGFVMPTCTLVLCYNRPTRPATILTIKWEHWTFKWSKKFLVDVAT